MTTQNTGWPVMECPPDWLEYDWRTGLWEATADAVTRHGFGVFVEWVHFFVVPAWRE